MSLAASRCRRSGMCTCAANENANPTIAVAAERRRARSIVECDTMTASFQWVIVGLTKERKHE